MSGRLVRSHVMGTSDSLWQLIDGHRSTALIYVAAKLGLADLLSQGAIRSEDLAARLDVKAPALHRVLRGLVLLNLLIEKPNGAFALTDLGRQLHSLGDYAILTGEEYAPAWAALLHSVTGGGAAFEKVFGVNVWEHRRRNPELGRIFQNWLGQQPGDIAEAILRAYDFKDARTIVDVGGGSGELLRRIMEAHPHLDGLLFELPEVLEKIGPQKFRTVAGDFFQRVPSGADLYFLKSVLHDWDDERCRQILQRCREAMTEKSRLLVIERLNPEKAEDDPATIFVDLHMMAVQGGRERTRAEFETLAGAVGLTRRQLLATDTGFVLMEFSALAS